MAFIQFIVSLIILGFIYSKMIKREVPSPIGKAQAIAPIFGGLISLLLSFAFFLSIAIVCSKFGYSIKDKVDVLSSLISAFLVAGLPEEIAKLLMILLSLWIFRKKIRNVYEYMLIGAGVGFGFTLFEEFLYGSNGISMIARVIIIAMHMFLGIIMAKHLGIAKYNKITGKGNVAKEYALALIIPIALHTIYDACTACNYLLKSKDDNTIMIGIILGIIAVIAFFIIQIKILIDFKKDTEKYCTMEFIPTANGEAEVKSEVKETNVEEEIKENDSEE